MNNQVQSDQGLRTIRVRRTIVTRIVLGVVLLTAWPIVWLNLDEQSRAELFGVNFGIRFVSLALLVSVLFDRWAWRVTSFARNSWVLCLTGPVSTALSVGILPAPALDLLISASLTAAIVALTCSLFGFRAILRSDGFELTGGWFSRGSQLHFSSVERVTTDYQKSVDTVSGWAVGEEARVRLDGCDGRLEINTRLHNVSPSDVWQIIAAVIPAALVHSRSELIKHETIRLGPIELSRRTLRCRPWALSTIPWWYAWFGFVAVNCALLGPAIILAIERERMPTLGVWLAASMFNLACVVYLFIRRLTWKEMPRSDVAQVTFEGGCLVVVDNKKQKWRIALYRVPNGLLIPDLLS